MAKSFSVETLVNVAVLDERSGTRMYREMADATDNPFLTEAFTDLALQEEKHEERFQGILNGLESAGAPEPVNYPDEYVDYLEVLISDGSSSRGTRGEVTGLDNPGLVDLAMKFEQEHLNLQRDMASILGEKHRGIVDQVIREEMGHLVTLGQMKTKISG